MTTDELLAKELAEIPARVDRGWAFMDLRHGPGGWQKRIDPETFWVQDGGCCVVGQVDGDFYDVFDRGSDDQTYKEAGELGLNVPWPLVRNMRESGYDRESVAAERDYYLALEAEWRKRLGFPQKGEDD